MYRSQIHIKRCFIRVNLPHSERPLNTRQGLACTTSTLNYAVYWCPYVIYTWCFYSRTVSPTSCIYTYKLYWNTCINIPGFRTFKYYSVLNPLNYYFVFNSLEILLCFSLLKMLLSFQYIENVTQFSIYWKCYSVFNILKMLIHFWSIQNHTLFSIYRLCYSILNICWIIPCFHSIQILICLQSIKNVTLF